MIGGITYADHEYLVRLAWLLFELPVATFGAGHDFLSSLK